MHRNFFLSTLNRQNESLLIFFSNLRKRCEAKPLWVYVSVVWVRIKWEKTVANFGYWRLLLAIKCFSVSFSIRFQTIFIFNLILIKNVTRSNWGHFILLVKASLWKNGILSQPKTFIVMHCKSIGSFIFYQSFINWKSNLNLDLPHKNFVNQSMTIYAKNTFSKNILMKAQITKL